MTVLTDVPQSGVYFQAGAIVKLVCRIEDIDGNPIPLQTATAMSISLLYPDRNTSVVFSASLYTDGSDGRIVYTTVNNGTDIDLSQVGLYLMQGQAVIGGIPLPPSYKTDFYVLENVTGNPSPPAQFTASAVILFDSNGARWAGTIVAGTLVWALTPSGPSNFLMFNSLVMKDPAGLYWTVTISTVGIPIATPGGSFINAVESFILMDSSAVSWVVTISEAGVLTAA